MSSTMLSRIMYIERKAGEISGDARIGRVSYSKSRKRLYYNGQTFQTLRGSGFKANYFDVDTGDEYWISGCKKRGGDRLYPGLITIDDDVRDAYWLTIREQPERVGKSVIRCAGKYAV
ncbi:MAG TPA: hypothetical protein VGN72_05650 [Tepidisphaeraceae bacterium]|jgi:hypothetical protein|nr:hypothetical protein [Tepidisphaeraceae bacterium]